MTPGLVRTLLLACRFIMVIRASQDAGERALAMEHPVHYAVERGDLDEVQEHIEADPHLLHSTSDMSYPLLVTAALRRQVHVLTYLISKGAELDACGADGWTALSMACLLGREDMVKALVDAGASVRVVNNDGHTPVMIAAMEAHGRILSVLLRSLDAAADGQGSVLDMKDKKGRTAIWHACRWGLPHILRTLIASGAEPACVDNEGVTAMDIAKQNGHHKCTRLLQAFETAYHLTRTRRIHDTAHDIVASTVATTITATVDTALTAIGGGRLTAVDGSFGTILTPDTSHTVTGGGRSTAVASGSGGSDSIANGTSYVSIAWGRMRVCVPRWLQSRVETGATLPAVDFSGPAGRISGAGARCAMSSGLGTDHGVADVAWNASSAAYTGRDALGYTGRDALGYAQSGGATYSEASVDDIGCSVFQHAVVGLHPELCIDLAEYLWV